MGSSTFLDLLHAALSTPHLATALQLCLPHWLAPYLPALVQVLRRLLGRRASRDVPPPGSRVRELEREPLAQAPVARHVGHLSAGKVGGSAHERRPPLRPGPDKTPRDIERPLLAAARSDAAKLGKQPLATKRAKPAAAAARAGHARSSRSGPTSTVDLVHAGDSMPLTARDLAQIRRVIHEEIELAFRRDDGRPTTPLPDDDERDPAMRALAEFGRSMARAARGEPGAAEQALHAEATYRGQFDVSWRRRARRKLGMSGEEPLDLEVALRALPLMKRRTPSPAR